MRISGSFMSWAGSPAASRNVELGGKGHVRLVFSSFAAGARNSCALIDGATVSGDSRLASRMETEIERE